MKMNPKDIRVDAKRFQRRSKPFSEARASRIAAKWDWGQYEHIKVWYDAKDKCFYVISGHHRLAAALICGHAELEVIVFEGTETEAKRIAKLSNGEREDYTPLEYGEMVAEDKADGKTIGDIAGEFGKPVTFLNQCEFLNECSSLIKERIESGTLDYRFGAVCGKYFAGNKERQNTFIEVLIDGKDCSINRFREYVKRLSVIAGEQGDMFNLFDIISKENKERAKVAKELSLAKGILTGFETLIKSGNGNGEYDKAIRTISETIRVKEYALNRIDVLARGEKDPGEYKRNNRGRSKNHE